MGHVEKDTHQYHYHTAPICLLSKLNIPIPNATSLKYMLSSHPLPYWPATSSAPSPIIGWAMDGYPIKGPYDDDNKIIVRSNLDSCGGAIDPSTGEYTYYMTAEPPYFPSCFRAPPGSLVERPYVASDYSTVSACPRAGYNLTLINPAFTLDLPALSPPVCNEPYDGPFFLFRLDIDLTEPWWGYSSKVFGAFFAFFFCYIAHTFRELVNQRIVIASSKNYKTIQFALLIMLCGCRAFSLFVDPYYTDKSVPPILVGNMYGIVYPIMDSLLALEIISLYTIVQSFTEKSTSRKVTASARKVFLIFSACEFLTQIFADTMRSFGHDFKWLMICQIYFVIWGLLLCTGFTLYGYQLYTNASRLVKAKSGATQNDLQLYLNRIMLKQIWCALISLVIVILSIYGLANQTMNEDEYASFVLFQRLIELGLVVIVFLSLLPPHWLGSYFTTGSNAKFKASVLMKHSKRQSKEDSSLISSRSTQSSDEGDNWDTGLAPKEIKKQVSKRYTTFKTPKIAPQGSTISKAEIEFNTVISQVRSSAVTKIIAAEELPMVVVPLQDFLKHGRIPRSSDKLTRVKQEADLAIFISHRWWAPQTPDTDDLLKYNILCRGLKNLVRREEKLNKNQADVVIWMDFACIEQDNADELMKGVRSLIAWSLRSDYFLVPVHPEGAEAFKTAQSPNELSNYGNRAWCRVEFYIFLCLAEICGEELKCFGYGPVDSRSNKKGTVPALCGFEKNAEVLKTMADSFHGAKFDSSAMPSNGDLFNESDRASIKLLEKTINSDYTTCVFEVAKRRIAEMSKGELNLGFKQLSDTSTKSMLDNFFSDTSNPVLKLKLEGNMFSSKGLREMQMGGSFSSVMDLDLSFNNLGEGAGEVIGKILRDENVTFNRLRLIRCGLKDEDLKEIFGSLGKAVKEDEDERARQPNMSFLDLSENDMGDEGSDALLDALLCGTCTRMKALLLNKCNLNDVSGGEAL